MPGKQELIIAEEGEYYAQVEKPLGNGKFLGKYNSTTGPRSVLLTLRGALKRKKKKRSNLVEVGSWVLIVLDYDTSKGWIVSKYQDGEVKLLKKMGDIIEFENTKNTKNTKNTTNKKQSVSNEDTGIVFEGDDDEVSDNQKDSHILEDDSDSAFDMDAI